MSEAKKIAVVTGASGYAAAHVIKGLVQRGYHVRGTVRNKAKAEPLTKLFPELELFEADLLKEGSFDEAIKGATYVFHTASPFPPGTPTDPQKELVEPALLGTMNVLHSVEKTGAPTVKRVVLTSSIAAIAGKRPEGHIYTEEDWNLDSTVDFEPYRYSKRIAEETAWKFTKEKGISLIAINPSFIVGPPLTAAVIDATSVKKCKAFFEGKFDQTCFGVVDVRDVAEAHIRAAENPNASGRYMLTSFEAVTNFELSQHIRSSGQFDQYDLPKENPTPAPTRLKYSNEKSKKELGIEYIPLQKSLVDMANALIALGIVEKK